mgnify:CR=1 FL=1
MLISQTKIEKPKKVARNIMKKKVTLCPNCGAHMTTSKEPISPPDPADKKFLIGYIASKIGVVVFIVLGIVRFFNF